MRIVRTQRNSSLRIEAVCPLVWRLPAQCTLSTLSALTDAGRRGGRPLHARCHRNALSLKHRLIITDARLFSPSLPPSLCSTLFLCSVGPVSLSLFIPLPGRHLYTLAALPGHQPGSPSTAILPPPLRNPSFSHQRESLLFPTSSRRPRLYVSPSPNYVCGSVVVYV